MRVLTPEKRLIRRKLVGPWRSCVICLVFRTIEHRNIVRRNYYRRRKRRNSTPWRIVLIGSVCLAIRLVVLRGQHP